MANKLCKQIDLGINPMTGKRIRKRIYGTSKTDLERNIKNAVAEFAKHGNPSEITFGKYKEKWIEAYCTNVASSTLTGYKCYLKHTDHLNNIKMKNIIQADLQKVINDLWNTKATGKKLACLLGAIWKNAVVDGVVDKDITMKLKKPSKKNSTRRAFTKEELNVIKKIDFTEQEQLLVNILRQFGLRPGEALALMPSDFNRKDLTLTINKALAHKENDPFIKTTKTGVTRVIPCPAEFFKLLPKSHLYLFTNKEGKLLTKSEKVMLCRNISYKINVAMGGNRKIKVANYSVYMFRHTKATEFYYMQKDGVTLKMAASYLGHSEKMLLDVYSHLDESKENTDILRKMVI